MRSNLSHSHIYLIHFNLRIWLECWRNHVEKSIKVQLLRSNISHHHILDSFCFENLTWASKKSYGEPYPTLVSVKIGIYIRHLKILKYSQAQWTDSMGLIHVRPDLLSWSNTLIQPWLPIKEILVQMINSFCLIDL